MSVNVSKVVKQGTIHKTPKDLREILILNEKILDVWNNLTPLARNEWICWVTLVEKQETREKHLERLKRDLISGKRRPCCWPGCPHHRLSAEKYFKARKVNAQNTQNER